MTMRNTQRRMTSLDILRVVNMDADDTETLFLADRAAEWLVRLETASPQEHAEFRRWLAESPLHVREALAATAVHLLLVHLFCSSAIDPALFEAQLDNVNELASEPGTGASATRNL
jgi:ferric-dicitrate binding protein FerR (iron transport regulator)